MCAAYTDTPRNYSIISPHLSAGVNEHLSVMNRLHKLLLEVIDKVGNIYSVVSTDLLTLIETSNKKINEVTKGKTNPHCGSILFFIYQFLKQTEVQANIFKTLKTSLRDTVVNPLREILHKKKEMGTTSFHYAQTFHQQIQKRESDLQKRYKQYSEAAAKLKPGNVTKKHLQIFHDSHNTYLLRLSSVNSINHVYYTHILPNTMHTVEVNHSELNNKFRHHISNMVYVQNDAWNKMIASGDRIRNATSDLDMLIDLQNFIKSTNEVMKDKAIPTFKFFLPGVEQGKTNVFGNSASTFIIDDRTRPNLQRRLASLQQQTGQLVDEISAMRSADKEKMQYDGDISLSDLMRFLRICDREANLDVLLKQMELYTPEVIDFLGPIPDNLLLERTKRSRRSVPDSSFLTSHGIGGSDEAQRPHEFIEPRVMKPITCVYCAKLVSLIGKGYFCKVCKVTVHKKCATNVQFCEPLKDYPKTQSAPPEAITAADTLAIGGAMSAASSTMSEAVNTIPPTGNSPMSETGALVRCSSTYDLIDLESEDQFYYDANEFDGGLSDESDDGSDFETKLNYSRLVSAPSTSDESNAPTAARVLPDLLKFNSATSNIQPIYESVFSASPGMTTNMIPISPGTTVADAENKDSEEQVYHEIFDNTVCSREKRHKPPASQINVLQGKWRLQQQQKQQSQQKTPQQQTRKQAEAKGSPVLERIQLFEKNKLEEYAKPFIPQKPLAEKPGLSAKANYNLSHAVEDIIPTTKPVAKTHAILKRLVGSTKEAAERTFCVALYDFYGSDTSYLSFVSGSKFELLEKSNDEWWRGSFNGIEGYFPGQYVLEVNEKDTIMRALFDFSRKHESELNVEEGEILVFVGEGNDGWLTVRSKDGKGLVPASYAMPL